MVERDTLVSTDEHKVKIIQNGKQGSHTKIGLSLFFSFLFVFVFG